MGWLWLRCFTTHGIEASVQVNNQANQTRGRPCSVVFCLWPFNNGQRGSTGDQLTRTSTWIAHDFHERRRVILMRSEQLTVFKFLAALNFGILVQIVKNSESEESKQHTFGNSTPPSKYCHETWARQTTKVRQHQTGSGGRCHHNS